MSERKNIIEVKKKSIKEDERSDDSSKELAKNEFGFGISPHRLEVIMGLYKERGNDCKDLLYFQNQSGIMSLLNKLLTTETNGIKTTKGREEYFGSQ